MANVTSASTAEVDLTDFVCFDLYAASRALTAVYRPLLAPLGLTYPQYLVLVVLWQMPQRTVKQLGEALQLDYGTLTPLLRRMETNGLLTRERSETDERSVTVTLTPAGAALQSRSGPAQDAIRDAIGLSDRQTRVLQRSLRSLTASALSHSMSPS